MQDRRPLAGAAKLRTRRVRGLYTWYARVRGLYRATWPVFGLRCATPGLDVRDLRTGCGRIFWSWLKGDFFGALAPPLDFPPPDMPPPDMPPPGPPPLPPPEPPPCPPPGAPPLDPVKALPPGVAGLPHCVNAPPSGVCQPPLGVEFQPVPLFGVPALGSVHGEPAFGE